MIHVTYYRHLIIRPLAECIEANRRICTPMIALKTFKHQF